MMGKSERNLKEDPQQQKTDCFKKGLISFWIVFITDSIPLGVKLIHKFWQAGNERMCWKRFFNKPWDFWENEASRSNSRTAWVATSIKKSPCRYFKKSECLRA